jgi:hypothetical protein
VDDLIAKLSEAFHLPNAGDWIPDGSGKTLKCDGWEMQASVPSGVGYIALRSAAYKEVLKERAAAEEEKERKEFRP